MHPERLLGVAAEQTKAQDTFCGYVPHVWGPEHHKTKKGPMSELDVADLRITPRTCHETKSHPPPGLRLSCASGVAVVWPVAAWTPRAHAVVARPRV